MPESEPAPSRLETPPDEYFHPTGAPPVGAVLDSRQLPISKSSVEDSETTVGTGTSIALGCVFGTIVLIVIGLIFLVIASLIN